MGGQVGCRESPVQNAAGGGVETIEPDRGKEGLSHEGCAFGAAIFLLIGLDTALGDGGGLGMMWTDTIDIRDSIDAAESGRAGTLDSVLYVTVLIAEFLLL